MSPIGYVRKNENSVFLEIREFYRPGLRHLEHFSHVIVIWWADKHDNKKSRHIVQTKPPYAQDKTTGVFATRAEYRPNPVAITTVPITGVDHDKGMVHITGIDAYDGTPIVDLKAYFPVCDRVKKPRIPHWLSFWPEWLPEDGLDLEKNYDANE